MSFRFLRLSLVFVPASNEAAIQPHVVALVRDVFSQGRCARSVSAVALPWRTPEMWVNCLERKRQFVFSPGNRTALQTHVLDLLRTVVVFQRSYARIISTFAMRCSERRDAGVRSQTRASISCLTKKWDGVLFARCLRCPRLASSGRVQDIGDNGERGPGGRGEDGRSRPHARQVARRGGDREREGLYGRQRGESSLL